jgi:hypothetical protein
MATCLETYASVESGTLGRNAVRGLGHASGIRHRLDRAEGLGRLLECSDRAVHPSVDARRILALAFARFEDTINVSGRCIVLAADTIKDMLAESGGPGTVRIASLEAEDVRSHEAENEMLNPSFCED